MANGKKEEEKMGIFSQWQSNSEEQINVHLTHEVTPNIKVTVKIELK